MSARNLVIPPKAQDVFWTQLYVMSSLGRVAQALLLITPPHAHVDAFLDRLYTTLLCIADDKPCGVCHVCRKILQDGHPDIIAIQPETLNGAIKIEQIRELSQVVYQTPQLGQRRLIIIHPADALNHAAASALLKMLEEPAPSTVFILIAAQPNLLLPTILSRCQKYDVPMERAESDPLSLGQAYPSDAGPALLYEKRFTILSDLNAMIEGVLTPCEVAGRWSDFPLGDMLSFLYALTAKLLTITLVETSTLEVEYQEQCLFDKEWCPERLFSQLDTIQVLKHTLQQNITLNSALALERVLLTYLKDKAL